ncbi:hypothetical protein ATCC90586_010867 [Pythium insidiosum]|nr:hypothetical protein ATCC90586_010867 [Pythium insidiosum]
MATRAVASTRVFAALGTNLGDRVQHLEAALALLRERAGPIDATSRLYCTAPQYVEDQPAFFNIVVQLSTALSPAALLETFKSIERDVGRTVSFRYGPRVIDVDVLFYGDQVVSTTTRDGPLLIPHERIAERDFVLVPFCDIAPDWQHPVLRQSMRSLLQSLQQSQPNAASPELLLPAIKTAPWRLGAKTLVMGILNVTPDSFSDGDEALATDVDRAVERALEMERDGVDVLDIGGESTRPGAEPVPLDEELRRVVPVIQGIRARGSQIAISVDTTKAAVARAAIEAGANLVNDVSAGEKDPEMLATVAALQVPIVLMHMRGSPQTMTTLKAYDDVVQDVAQYLRQRVEAAKKAGIYSWNILVDPGVGFAKDGELNLAVLRRLRELKQACHGLPVLVGASRKGFIGKICGRPEPKDRAWGTAATCCAAIAGEADVLRVHDLPAMVDVAKMADAIWRPTS